MTQIPDETACSAVASTEINFFGGKTSHRTLPDELLAKAFALRKRGCTYQQIADCLGISLGAAYKYVRVETIRQEEATRRRALAECDSLLKTIDEVEPGLVEQGQQGNAEARIAVRKLIETRCDLLKRRGKLLLRRLVESIRVDCGFNRA